MTDSRSFGFASRVRPSVLPLRFGTVMGWAERKGRRNLVYIINFSDRTATVVSRTMKMIGPSDRGRCARVGRFAQNFSRHYIHYILWTLCTAASTVTSPRDGSWVSRRSPPLRLDLEDRSIRCHISRENFMGASVLSVAYTA